MIPTKLPIDAIPARIKRIRYVKRYTAREMAEKSGMTPQQWSRYENLPDGASFSVRTFYAILDALGVSIEEFIFWPNHPWENRDKQDYKEFLNEDGSLAD